MTDYVQLFARLVRRIEQHHGPAGSVVLTPQLKLRRVTGVWFIDGKNHGIRVDGAPHEGTGPRIEAWGTTGLAGFVALVPAGASGHRILTMDHLESVAHLVRLLPTEHHGGGLGWPDPVLGLPIETLAMSDEGTVP